MTTSGGLPATILTTAFAALLAAASAPRLQAFQVEPQTDDDAGEVQLPSASSPCGDSQPPPGATLTPSRDLYCIFLTPRPGLEHMSGQLELRTPHTPFGVAVNPAGNHLYEGILTLAGLPAPSALGDYEYIVAWLATPLFDRIVSLGPVANGDAQHRRDRPQQVHAPRHRRGTPRCPGVGGTPAAARDFAERPHVATRHAGVPVGSDGRRRAHGGTWARGDGWRRRLATSADDAGTHHVPSADGARSTRREPLPPRCRHRSGNPSPGAATRCRRACRWRRGSTSRPGLVRRRIRGRDHVMYGFNGQYPGPVAARPPRRQP